MACELKSFPRCDTTISTLALFVRYRLSMSTLANSENDTRQLIDELLTFEPEQRKTATESRNSSSKVTKTPTNTKADPYSGITKGLRLLATKLDVTTSQFNETHNKNVQELSDSTNELRKTNSLLTQLADRLESLESRQTQIEKRQHELEDRVVRIENSITDVDEFTSRFVTLESHVKDLTQTNIQNNYNIRKLRYENEEELQRSYNLKLILSCKLQLAARADENEPHSAAEMKEIQVKVRECMSTSLDLDLSLFDDMIVRPLRIDNISKFLIVLPDFRLRIKIFSSLGKMKPKDFYIQEYLVKRREQLLYDLRQMVKSNDKLLTSTYTRDGELFLKYAGNQKPTLIREINPILHGVGFRSPPL